MHFLDYCSGCRLFAVSYLRMATVKIHLGSFVAFIESVLSCLNHVNC